MRNARKSPPAGARGGSAALSAIALAVIVTGCASGGGAPAPSPEERDALLARYAGEWVLDEAASSPQMSIPRPDMGRETRIVSSDEIADLRREIEEGNKLLAIRHATYQLLRRRPNVLSLAVPGDELVYVTPSAEDLRLPLGGGWVVRTEEQRRIRSRVFWEGPRIGLEHVVDSEGRVRVVLEIVEGRLEMTRTMRFGNEGIAPLVPVYGRRGAGG